MAPHLVDNFEDPTMSSKTTTSAHDKPFTTTSKLISISSLSEDRHDDNDAKPKRNWLMGEQAFQARMPHHSGIKALWETKWKLPCSKSVYPFHDGAYEDFAPIFEYLIVHDINDGTCPEYTRAFFDTAEKLEVAGDTAAAAAAAAALSGGGGGGTGKYEAEKASELYLRAACVLRIARFPYISAHVSREQDPAKWTAWVWQKKVYMKAAGEGQVWDRLGISPVVEVDIPHVSAQPGDLGRMIPAYVRMPRIPAGLKADDVGDDAGPGPGHPVSPASDFGADSPASGLWTLEAKEQEEQHNLRSTQEKRRKRGVTSSSSFTYASNPASSASASTSRSSTPPPPNNIDDASCITTTKHPVVILLTGLDGYRPDNTARCNEFLARGWACVVLEIPGTADCPADPADPEASERLWDSVFAWMKGYRYQHSTPTTPTLTTPVTNHGTQIQTPTQQFDLARVLSWGLSAGGYHAVRMAHTHASLLAGVVAQGAGTHFFFDTEWIERADGHEYPFQLAPAMAMKHGYESVEAYKYGDAMAKWSLLENRILGRGRSARLLLVNGTQDGLMPIEDSMLLFEHGSPKEARFFPGALHMGYPLANSAVYPWMEQVIASIREESLR